MGSADDQSERLDDFTKEEWWDVARAACPGITAEEFDRLWAEFVVFKTRKRMH